MQLLLVFGWGTAAFLICTMRGHDQPLPKGLGGLAVFGCSIALLGFGFHVARMFSWQTMMYAAALTTTVVYMFVLPAWLIWLGIALRARSEPSFVAYASSTKTGGPHADGDVEMAPPHSSGAQSRARVGQARGGEPALSEIRAESGSLPRPGEEDVWASS